MLPGYVWERGTRVLAPACGRGHGPVVGEYSRKLSVGGQTHAVWPRFGQSLNMQSFTLDMRLLVNVSPLNDTDGAAC
eukprot:10841275-Lingulodinium_polyedra.AAC.1